jgi:hypothetical protein
MRQNLTSFNRCVSQSTQEDLFDQVADLFYWDTSYSLRSSAKCIDDVRNTCFGQAETLTSYAICKLFDEAIPRGCMSTCTTTSEKQSVNKLLKLCGLGTFAPADTP